MKKLNVLSRLTLRARLTLIYAGLFFAAGIVLLGVTYALFNQQLVRSSPKVVTQGSSTLGEAGTGGLPDAGPIGSKQTYVLTENGDMLRGAQATQWLTAQQERLHDAAITSLLVQGGIALLIVGGAAAGFGWLVAGRVLAPLHRVTETARRIAAAPAAERGLHERIGLPGPHDEVKNLADAFDTMVERLDRSFDGQRRFVANASHELRTPLTLGRSLVEIAMHRKTASSDVKQLGETLLEINSRHERLISGLLLLASSENELTVRRPVDLADVVTHVAAQSVAQAEAEGVLLRAETTEAPTSGDALLLERLVHNLVENGIRHNSAGPDRWVRVACRARHDGRVELLVVNTGPEVPAYEVPALFDPFRRLNTDRLAGAKGAGLGLSIVRSVAVAHGGEVTARPRPGGGLMVTVLLPLTEIDTPAPLLPARPLADLGPNRRSRTG